MMPKVTMKAPPQIDGGTIHASKSGKNYFLDAEGKVTVDSADMSDLLGVGFTVVPSDGSDASQVATTTSPSLTSATQGAHALDPAARQANQRTEIVEPGAAGTSADFGGAVPPHGLPHSDPAATKPDAEAEAATKAATGSDPSQPSAQPETGATNQQAAPAGVQQQAAEDASKAS